MKKLSRQKLKNYDLLSSGSSLQTSKTSSPAKPSFSKHVAHKPRLDPALVFCKQTADLFLFIKNVLLIKIFCYHPILSKLCEIEVLLRKYYKNIT